MVMKQALERAFKAVKNKIPGAIVACSWSQVTAGGYDPVTGGNTSTTKTVNFEGALSEYSTHEKQVQGVEAGDVRLIVIATIDKPRIGDVITIGSDSFDVINLGDYAGIAYDIQLRRK